MTIESGRLATDERTVIAGPDRCAAVARQIRATSHYAHFDGLVADAVENLTQRQTELPLARMPWNSNRRMGGDKPGVKNPLALAREAFVNLIRVEFRCWSSSA
jgi:hypothetical protein